MKRLITMFLSIMVLSVSAAFAQYVAKGVVVDASGEPVIGAAVLQKGTMNGTQTGLDGDFTLSVPSESTLLEISFLGYRTVEIAAGKASRVVMIDDTKFLDEVVVIGYGTVKKSDMTGSVAALKADQVNKGSITSPSEMLQGKAAGVVITTGDGQPGSSSTIRIRGGSSLNASNDPLIIIDGLPISNTGVSGMSDQLSSINPNDIENFTVLKDASATAIYGSRASNGVIIITTKKGNKRDAVIPKIAVDYTASVSQNTKFVNVMTGDEMRAAVQKYAQTISDGENALAALGTENTDWQKEIYQMAWSHDANISLQGNVNFGKEAYMPYRVSGGYLDKTGTLKTGYMKRGTMAINLNPTFLDEHLTVNLSAKGVITNNRFANGGAITQAVQYDPTQPVYGTAQQGLDGYRMWGSWDGTSFIPNNMANQNPVAMLNQYNDISTARRIITNGQIDYKIHGLEDLKLHLNLGLDYVSSDGTKDSPVGCEMSYHDKSQIGSGYHGTYSQIRNDQTLELYADYNKTISKHTIGAMTGYSWQHFYREENSHDMRQSDKSSLKDPYVFKTENFLVSFFGRLNYNYDERYFLTATVRYDGTSRFANNKWGFFPSAAFAWNVKNEGFLEDVDAVSNLKLRLSYGQTGQQELNSGDYPSIPAYTTNLLGSYYVFGNQNVIVPITPKGYNADLKWETTTTYNAGLDFAFMKGGRIYGSIDAYYRLTTDLLNYTPIAAGANLTNYLNANIGELKNKGIEVELGAIIIDSKDWSWKFDVNGAYNRNIITKLTSNDGPDYTGVATGGISGGTGNTIQRYMVGYPINTFYVYQQVYDEQGKPIMGAYVDRNEDGTVNDKDKYCFGQAAPVVSLGFNTTFSWKNLSLNVAGHGNIGNWVYNNNYSNMSLLTDLWTNNFINNRNPNAMYLGFTEAQYWSDYYIEKADFFKLDRITLNYMLPIKNIGNLNIFGTVQNVAVFSNYDGIDPEIFSGIDNNLYPRPRTYILGVKFNF
ncbi:MAG: TonB-dependent receptor [Bacteroidales bacterium]|nr:TonB-dependent receptor [Bacteroidales bacterium]